MELDEQKLHEILRHSEKVADGDYTIVSVEEFPVEELYRTNSPDNEADYEWVAKLYEVTVNVTSNQTKIVIGFPDQEWHLIHSFRER